MAQTAHGGHHPRGQTALERRSAPGQLAIVRGRLGEAHGDARADGGRQTHQKGGPCILRGKGGGKDRRKGRDRAIHQPGQARLHPGQHELAVRDARLGLLGVTGQVLRLEIARDHLMACLGRRQITQQLACRGIGAALCGLVVEGFRVPLHPLGLGADAVDAHVLHQPDRAAGIEPRHMLAPDQRDHIAKPRRMQVDQTAAVLILLGGHAVENRRSVGIIGTQPLGIAAVDAGVILLGRDGKRQHLSFGEIAEVSTLGEERHGSNSWNVRTVLI